MALRYLGAIFRAFLLHCCCTESFGDAEKCVYLHTDKSEFEMANHSIEIDCSGMTKLSLNIKMKELLGFPDFYGMNWDAMIDCLSYMRQPSAGMSSVALNDDEALVIYCKNLSEASFDIAVFIDVIRAVNEREINAGKSAQIFLCPIP